MNCSIKIKKKTVSKRTIKHGRYRNKKKTQTECSYGAIQINNYLYANEGFIKIKNCQSRH